MNNIHFMGLFCDLQDHLIPNLVTKLNVGTYCTKFTEETNQLPFANWSTVIL